MEDKLISVTFGADESRHRSNCAYPIKRTDKDASIKLDTSIKVIDDSCQLDGGGAPD